MYSISKGKLLSGAFFCSTEASWNECSSECHYSIAISSGKPWGCQW